VRLFRASLRVSPDGGEPVSAETQTMNELLAERVAWRRKSQGHQYVGLLLALPDRLRLVGREPTFGIDVALSIPFTEIESVRPATRATEKVLGEPGVTLELAGSEPIFLRELGSRREPRRLAETLSLIASPRPELATSA